MHAFVVIGAHVQIRATSLQSSYNNHCPSPMITALAYILSFFAAPLIGALAMLVAMPLALALGPILFGLLSGAATSFVGCWVATLIFSWLSVEAGFSMFLPVLIGFLMNDINRILTRGKTPFEVASLVGDLLGVAIAADQLLP
jgi:hypothetical protein